jgi:sulfopyruvate decarboxylase TPP-binding subunit
MSSIATITISGPVETLADLGTRQAVLLPLDEYQTLLNRIEELEDIIDSRIALAEYQAGQGRSLQSYLAERKERYHVPGGVGEQES